MVKYYFSSLDGEVYINLPSSVSNETIRRIMSDCRFKTCYIYVLGGRFYPDLDD